MAELHNLPLTKEEGRYLLEALQFWTEGYEDTAEELITDLSLESVEELLQATATARGDINRGTAIANRLRKLLGMEILNA